MFSKVRYREWVNNNDYDYCVYVDKQELVIQRARNKPVNVLQALENAEKKLKGL